MSVTIGVILGSTRPQRAGAAVAKWFMGQTTSTEDVKFELIDLEEVNLPLLDEPIPPSAGKYQNEHTKKWSETINRLDGFIVVTAEYNHSVPGALKNALDFLYQEWNHKPIGYVSYGSAAGGSRAVEHLRLIAVEQKMVPVRDQVLIPVIWEAVQDGVLNPEFVKGDPQKLIDEVIWWAKLLQPARQS